MIADHRFRWPTIMLNGPPMASGNQSKRKKRVDRVSMSVGKVIKVEAEGWGVIVAPLLAIALIVGAVFAATALA